MRLLRPNSIPLNLAATASNAYDGELITSCLEQAILGSESPFVSYQYVQRLAAETPELFCDAALSLLTMHGDTPAARIVVSRLLQVQSLLRRLVDPGRMGKEQSVYLFRLLRHHESTLDFRLAHCLPTRDGHSSLKLSPASCQRALDVLDAVSEGRRIVPILGHLVDHPLEALAAKATLVIGKRVRSASWARRLLEKGRHNRVRANALETIWGLADGAELLAEHTHDSNNRVAGNAIFGLHLLGNPQAAEGAVWMAGLAEPDFRWTAVWLLSKFGKPEHAVVLRKLARDEVSAVRRAAIRVLARLGPAQNQVAAKPDPVEAVLVPEPQPVAQPTPMPEPAPVPVPLPDPEPEFQLRLDGKWVSSRRS